MNETEQPLNRFDCFTPEEREQIRYGLRNCSLYDADESEEKIVFSLIDEVTSAKNASATGQIVKTPEGDVRIELITALADALSDSDSHWLHKDLLKRVQDTLEAEAT